MKHLACILVLFAALFLPACETPSPGTVKTPEQVALERAAKVRGASGTATLAALLAAPEEDRPRLARDLSAAADVIASLSTDASSGRIQELITAYIGGGRPEYRALGIILADQFAVWAGPVAVPDVVKWIAQGVKSTASAFTTPVK